MRIRMILAGLAMAAGLHAQEMSYKQVNDSTFTLYEAGDWRGLLAFGAEARKDGHDFYYLLIRQGIAAYELKRYHTAEKHLRRALALNDTEFGRSYLYWSLLLQGTEKEAAEVYNSLSDEYRQPISHRNKALASTYALGGVKFSNLGTVGNIYYFMGGLTHKIGNRLSINHSYSRFDQVSEGDNISLSLSETRMKENQYALQAEYLVGGSDYIRFSSILSKTSFAQQQAANSGAVVEVVNGNYRLQNLAFQLSYTKRWNQFRLSPSIQFVTQRTTSAFAADLPPPPGNPGLPGVTETLDTTFRLNQFAVGGRMNYIPSWAGDRLNIGLASYLTILDGNLSGLVKPQITVTILPKLWWKADYLLLSDNFYSDMDIQTLFNPNTGVPAVIDDSTRISPTGFPAKQVSLIRTSAPDGRFSTGLTCLAGQKLYLSLIYINERFENSTLQLNSVFLGLNYKL